MNRAQIKDVFIYHGFTIKEGQTDLKEYVYEAAEALLRIAQFEAQSGSARMVFSVNPDTDEALVVSRVDHAIDIDVPFQAIMNPNVVTGAGYESVTSVSMSEVDIPDVVQKFEAIDMNPLGEFMRWHTGLPVKQEPKYTVDGNHIINRASGKEIPHDEPVFILRASDYEAMPTLLRYLSRISLRDAQIATDDFSEHHKAVWKRIDEFKAFKAAHPERMKTPDTEPLPEHSVEAPPAFVQLTLEAGPHTESAMSMLTDALRAVNVNINTDNLLAHNPNWFRDLVGVELKLDVRVRHT